MTNTLNTRLIEPATTVVEITGRLHLGNSLSYAETSIKRLIADGSRKLGVRPDRARLHRLSRSGDADQLLGGDGSSRWSASNRGSARAHREDVRGGAYEPDRGAGPGRGN